MLGCCRPYLFKLGVTRAIIYFVLIPCIFATSYISYDSWQSICRRESTLVSVYDEGTPTIACDQAAVATCTTRPMPTAAMLRDATYFCYNRKPAPLVVQGMPHFLQSRHAEQLLPHHLRKALVHQAGVPVKKYSWTTRLGSSPRTSSLI
jgi:hypothetical protein